MTPAAIEKAFNEVIKKRGIHAIAGRSLNSVLQLRYRHKHYGNVSINTKVFFLQKAKWPMEQYMYTQKDLVSLINFYNKSSPAAKNLGTEYIIEKWKAKT